MSDRALEGPDRNAFERALRYCKEWGTQHQAEVGIAEMALGAGLLSWGAINGHIEIGRDVIASSLGEIGGLAGMGIGSASGAAIAATILKGIFVGGVVGVQGTFALPAFAIIGGATAILGAFGYTAGDLIGRIVDPPMGYKELLGEATIVLVGAALLIDGARRLVTDKRLLETASSLKDGAIYFSAEATNILASTPEAFKRLIEEFDKTTAARCATYSGVAGAGAAGGGIWAGTTVTVLGSKALGAAALSLGLVSAPVWPVIAGGAAGLALGVAAWKGITYFHGKE